MRGSSRNRMKLGGKQTLVLDLIMRSGKDAYGAELARQLEQAGFPTALPQVYSILEKLERMGLVTSFMSDPSPERGGRRKKVYRITAGGQGALMDVGPIQRDDGMDAQLA